MNSKGSAFLGGAFLLPQIAQITRINTNTVIVKESFSLRPLPLSVPHVFIKKSTSVETEMLGTKPI